MADRVIPPDELVAILTETPQRIDELTRDVAASLLVTAPAEGQWSARDLVVHWRACADVFGDAARAIAGGTTTLRATSPTTWIDRTGYLGLDFASSFAAFQAQRDELLAFLDTLPDEAWTASTTVTGAGAPLTRTVQSYIRWLATHERGHLRQLRKTLAAVEA